MNVKMLNKARVYVPESLTGEEQPGHVLLYSLLPITGGATLSQAKGIWLDSPDSAGEVENIVVFDILFPTEVEDRVVELIYEYAEAAKAAGERATLFELDIRTSTAPVGRLAT